MTRNKLSYVVNNLCYFECSFQLSFGSLVAVDEKITYEPHPEDVSKTLLRQEAVVTVQGMPLSSYFENVLTSKISHNASKVRKSRQKNRHKFYQILPLLNFKLICISSRDVKLSSGLSVKLKPR